MKTRASFGESKSGDMKLQFKGRLGGTPFACVGVIGTSGAFRVQVAGATVGPWTAVPTDIAIFTILADKDFIPA